MDPWSNLFYLEKVACEQRWAQTCVVQPSGAKSGLESRGGVADPSSSEWHPWSSWLIYWRCLVDRDSFRILMM